MSIFLYLEVFLSERFVSSLLRLQLISAEHPSTRLCSILYSVSDPYSFPPYLTGLTIAQLVQVYLLRCHLSLDFSFRAVKPTVDV